MFKAIGELRALAQEDAGYSYVVTQAASDATAMSGNFGMGKGFGARGSATDTLQDYAALGASAAARGERAGKKMDARTGSVESELAAMGVGLDFNRLDFGTDPGKSAKVDRMMASAGAGAGRAPQRAETAADLMRKFSSGTAPPKDDSEVARLLKAADAEALLPSSLSPIDVATGAEQLVLEAMEERDYANQFPDAPGHRPRRPPPRRPPPPGGGGGGGGSAAPSERLIPPPSRPVRVAVAEGDPVNQVGQGGGSNRSRRNKRTQRRKKTHRKKRHKQTKHKKTKKNKKTKRRNRTKRKTKSRR